MDFGKALWMAENNCAPLLFVLEARIFGRHGGNKRHIYHICGRPNALNVLFRIPVFRCTFANVKRIKEQEPKPSGLTPLSGMAVRRIKERTSS